MYHILLKHRGVNLQCWKLVAIKTLLDVWYVLNAQYTVFEKLVSTLYNIVRIRVKILISFTDLISKRGIKVLTCSTENEVLQNNNKAIILACFNDLAVLTAGLHCVKPLGDLSESYPSVGLLQELVRFVYKLKQDVITNYHVNLLKYFISNV